MGRPKDGAGIKSNLIIFEVQKRPCLFDSNDSHYSDRVEKAKCWEEVCARVVPGWTLLGYDHKFTAGKEVQKRWRSIRDSYTKAYRQGKCAPDAGPAAGRRQLYTQQMAFLYHALKNKKPRLSLDKTDASEADISFTSPIKQATLKIEPEPITEEVKPTSKKTKAEQRKTDPKSPAAKDKMQQTDCIELIRDDSTKSIDKYENSNKMSAMDVAPSIEIKIDANQILPSDHFDDDRQFMNSLVPFLKKMNDDTRLCCRIEVLKIIRKALQGNMDFDSASEAPVAVKQEKAANRVESTLSMTTRSADGSRPRKRKVRSPSPQLPSPPLKKRGPGRPRKIRPPSPAEAPEPARSAFEETLHGVSSIDQLEKDIFTRMFKLQRAKEITEKKSIETVNIKSEPVEMANTNDVI